MVRVCIGTILFFALGLGSLQTAAETPLAIKVLADKTLSKLPASPLFWRIETFPTLALARAAADVGPLPNVVASLYMLRVNEASGHGTYMPIQASSSGAMVLHALVMFVVDATKPFSSPANLP